jgi:PAP2 superfamily
MLSIKFTWLEAAVATALVLAVAAAAALARRRSGSPRLAVIAVFAREAGMLLGLFALWTYAGSRSEMSLTEALHRAAWIWHAEQDVGLPSEQALQQVFLPHPLLVQAFNWYYAVLHFPVLIGCLVWLFARHRGEYWRVRTLVLLFTGVSLLVQLIPVAPPRMLPLTKMTDTGLVYGQSVYGSQPGIDADQLSAMPSIHVGWALLVALVVVATARNRWRWLVLAYPVLTTLAVVVTANHFWLDGIAAVPLLALAIGVQRAAGPACRALAGAARRSRRVPVAAGAPEPVPAGTPVLAGAVSAGAVSAGAVSAGASTEPPGAAQAAAAPPAHAPGRPVPRPCAARAAASAGLASRNSPAHRPQARHTLPSHEQDGR